MSQMKPKFIRQDANKFKKLGIKWRKPKGIHSKMRNYFKGHRRNVSVGWKAPRNIRGLVGKLNNVVVYTLKQIEMVEPGVHAITIAGSVGLMKKVSMINKARERGIRILNIKNIDEYITRHQEKRVKRKKAKEKEMPKVKDVAKPEERPKEETMDEVKKEETKEELDKLLAKRT